MQFFNGADENCDTSRVGRLLLLPMLSLRVTFLFLDARVRPVQKWELNDNVAQFSRYRTSRR